MKKRRTNVQRDTSGKSKITVDAMHGAPHPLFSPGLAWNQIPDDLRETIERRLSEFQPARDTEQSTLFDLSGEVLADSDPAGKLDLSYLKIDDKVLEIILDGITTDMRRMVHGLDLSGR